MSTMATLSEEPRRRATLRDLRTAVSSRIRSKPTIEGQRFLDLYVLQRDRFRWLRLIQQAERSILSIDMALEKIGFTSEHRASTAAPASRPSTSRAAIGKARSVSIKRTKAA
jgi:hypothetical protein